MSVEGDVFDGRFLAKLAQLQLLARKMVQGKMRAERRSRQPGAGLEFADYRTYTRGDDPRMIDWSIYGRLERLFVRLSEEERDLPVYLLLDTSASMRWSAGMGAGSKFDHARRIVAALAYVALACLERVNVLAFGARLGEDTGFLRGKGRFHEVLEFLRGVAPAEGVTDFAASFRELARREKGRGVVVLVSDGYDREGVEPGLKRLISERFEVQWVHMTDPAEFSDRWLGDVQMEDAETGLKLRVAVDEQMLREARGAAEAFRTRVRDFCRARGVSWCEASTAEPFEDVVLRGLREGRILA